MSRSSDRPPIGFFDFERIFRTIHGLLLSEKADPARACLFFGIIGASILHAHYKQPATVACGFAAYKIDETNDVLVLGTQKDGVLASDASGFHCWIQCGDWLLDFASPVFQEMFARCGIEKKCGRKMFQRHRSDMCESFWDLSLSIGFFYGGNQELTNELIDNFFSCRAYEDMIHICLQWYKPLPNDMRDAIDVSDSNGSVFQTRISPLRLAGAW
jgi:Protein of unknown function (DUF2026)